MQEFAAKQKNAWKEAVWVFGLSRLVILVVSYIAINRFTIGSFHLPEEVTKHNLAGGAESFLYSWWRWDVVHLVEIANHGYNVQNTAFFPLFPFLMHALGTLLGGSALSDYLAGLVISNACFYAALVLFYQLFCKDFEPAVVKNALLYLAFTPYAIGFFVGYTESLFLFLSMATFYFLRRGKALDWWLAGFCGFLAVLTRSTGVALAVPFLLIFLQKFGVRALFTWGNWKLKLNALASMALLPAGLLVYMLYLKITFGNPLIFSVEESHVWSRNFALPWMGIINAVIALFIPVHQTEIGLNDLLFTVIPIIILIIGWRRLPLKYSLFALVVILVGLCYPRYFGDSLNAAPRFVMLAFPIYLLFALWCKHPRIKYILVVLFLIFFITNIMLFVTQNWVA